MFERYHRDKDEVLRLERTGPCFICSIVTRHPAFPAHIVYEDEVIIAFLDKHPFFYGYTLVAPRAHRKQVTADFTVDEYLAVQRRVYWVAEAVRQEVNAQRLYVFSFGRNEGNAHVHWHIAPLPPDLPYEEQGPDFFGRGHLNIPEDEQGALAMRLRARIRQLGDDNEGA